MTKPQKVYQFLKDHHNHGFCDDCIEKKTGVDRHQVNTIASTLALLPHAFGRAKGVCPQGCTSREKLITMAK